MSSLLKDRSWYYINTDVQGGKVMDTEDGSNVVIWDLNWGPQQQWQAQKMTETDEWAFQSAEYGNYIMATGNDQELQLSMLDPVLNQELRWKVSGPQDAKTIESVAYPGPPLEVVDLQGKITTNGTPIILYDDNDGTNQMWGFAPV